MFRAFHSVEFCTTFAESLLNAKAYKLEGVFGKNLNSAKNNIENVHTIFIIMDEWLFSKYIFIQ